MSQHPGTGIVTYKIKGIHCCGFQGYYNMQSGQPAIYVSEVQVTHFYHEY